MRKFIISFSVLLITAAAVLSCKKSVSTGASMISDETLVKIHNQGFGTSDVQLVDEGYLVEGDIVLTNEFLNSQPGGKLLRVGSEEQYHTTNLVSTGSSRTITMSLASKLASKAGYPQALAEVANRYNALNLLIKFQVVSSGGNIVMSDAHGSYLASSGFPSGGNPYNSVQVNSRAIGSGTSTTFINYLATILTHEVGHCIGFRHTDYMDRSYSCGGTATNEGASTIGAILIPGTPSGPDPNSWMLACIGSNQNRPFNSNDVTALNYLY